MLMKNSTGNNAGQKIKSVAKWFGYVMASVLIIMSISIGVAYYNKDKILAYTLENINKHAPAKIEVKSIDFSFLTNFPSFSIVLRGAEIKDSLYPIHKHKLFAADELALQVYVLKLLYGELNVRSIIIKNANISMLTTKRGYSNFNFGSPKNQPEPTEETLVIPHNLKLKKIILQNVHFRLSDSLANKWFDISAPSLETSLEWADSDIGIKLDGLVHWGGLAFNPQLGAYMENKDSQLNIEGFFNAAEKKVVVSPSWAKIEGETYLLDGSLQMAKFPILNLHIHTDEARVEKVFTCLSRNVTSILSSIHLTNTVKATVTIAGELLPNITPRVDCLFSTVNNTGYHTSVPITASGMTFKGKITNQMMDSIPCDDRNSLLSIYDFTWSVPGVALTSTANITDFISPSLALNLEGDMKLAQTRELFKTLPFKFTNGTGKLELKFLGNVDQLVQTHKAEHINLLEGKITLTDASGILTSGNIKLDTINTTLEFDKQIFNMRQLSIQGEGSEININGYTDNMLPYLLSDKVDLYAAFILTSPRIDLGRALKKLASWKEVNQKNESKNKHQKKSKTSTANITANIKLNVKEIQFNKFKATEISGTAKFVNDNANLENLTLNAAGGSIALSSALNQINSRNPVFESAVKLNNVDVKSIFQSFDNFGQNLIQSQNLKGKLSSKITFSTAMHSDFKLRPATIKGNLKLSLKNGHLVNFQPIVNLSGFLFADRNFKDITFAELKNEFTLSGSLINISKMEVASNLLTFYLKGNYDFKNSQVDIHLKIPLSNLTKHESNFEPINIGIATLQKNNIHLKVFTKKNGKIGILPERAINF